MGIVGTVTDDLRLYHVPPKITLCCLHVTTRARPELKKPGAVLLLLMNWLAVPLLAKRLFLFKVNVSLEKPRSTLGVLLVSHTATPNLTCEARAESSRRPVEDGHAVVTRSKLVCFLLL